MSHNTKIRGQALKLERDDFRLDEERSYFKSQILSLSNSFPQGVGQSENSNIFQNVGSFVNDELILNCSGRLRRLGATSHCAKFFLVCLSARSPGCCGSQGCLWDHLLKVFGAAFRIKVITAGLSGWNTGSEGYQARWYSFCLLSGSRLFLRQTIEMEPAQMGEDQEKWESFDLV